MGDCALALESGFVHDFYSVERSAVRSRFAAELYIAEGAESERAFEDEGARVVEVLDAALALFGAFDGDFVGFEEVVAFFHLCGFPVPSVS